MVMTYWHGHIVSYFSWLTTTIVDHCLSALTITIIDSYGQLTDSCPNLPSPAIYHHWLSPCLTVTYPDWLSPFLMVIYHHWLSHHHVDSYLSILTITFVDSYLSSLTITMFDSYLSSPWCCCLLNNICQ